jgi:hypothetical protein
MLSCFPVTGSTYGTSGKFLFKSLNSRNYTIWLVVYLWHTTEAAWRSRMALGGILCGGSAHSRYPKDA